MTGTDRKHELLNAAQAAVADAKAKADARASDRPSAGRGREVAIVIGLAVVVVGLYLAALRPAWFLTPPPVPDPPAIQEASVRLTLVREAQRITDWRKANGRLPSDLVEAGNPVAGLAYERVNDSVFAVTMPFGPTLLTLRSTDSVSAFLGGSVGTVVSRVGR